MPTVAIPVRARFIIDFPLDNVREGPATPMSATIELLFSGRSIQSLQAQLQIVVMETAAPTTSKVNL
jgi:hypothetical protein